MPSNRRRTKAEIQAAARTATIPKWVDGPPAKVVTPDLEFHNHGSVVTLQPLTDAGREWVNEKISLDDWQSPSNIAIEPRYVADLVEGAKDDGLEVKLYG